MYKSRLQNEATDKLFEAILSLNDKEECYRFFEDVCTVGEISAMSQRLQVAALLSEGDTFNSIAEKTGASSATISRVNKCLTYGADGYTLVLDKTKNH